MDRVRGVTKDRWVLRPIAVGNCEASRPSARVTSLMAAAIEAAEGRGEPAIRRSRHASTYHLQLAGGGGRKLDFFVKVYRRPTGVEPVKRLLRRSRMDHAIKIGMELRNRGFSIAPILIRGANLRDGRSMLVTARAEGAPLADAIPTLAVNRKRMSLKKLGEEVARLHREGFIHGDLTPHNIFITQDPARFSFIDNDRTRRARPIGAARQRLRNFVQLGRFNLNGVTRADRMRVLRAYASALGLRNWHSLRKRAAAMLSERLDRDRMNHNSHPNARPKLSDR